MPGYTTDFVRYLDTGWSVAVFTNLDEAQGDPIKISRGVAAMISGGLL